MNQFLPHPLAIFCCATLALGLSLISAEAQSTSPSPPPASSPPQVKVDSSEPPRVAPQGVASLAPVVEKVAPSVVTIFTSRNLPVNDLRALQFFDPRYYRQYGGRADRMPRQQGLGSGVIVTKEGHIITSNHVIDKADEIMVAVGPEQKRYKAKKIGTDPATDIAVLKIDGDNFPAVTFADVDKARVGDAVLAIGNPFGVGQSVTSGIISAKSRGGMGITDYENFIQTDASINPGNSGGALVDTQGRLLGINTAILSRTGGNQGIGFAVPADLVRGVMQSILEKGRVVRGYLGVVVQPVTPDLAKTFGLKDDRGALVTEVTPDTPAAKAGLERGDVITALNGKQIPDPRELRIAVSTLNPDARVDLKFLHDAQEKTAQVTLEELPAAQARLAGRGTAGNELGGVTLSDLSEPLRQKYNIPSDVTGALITDVPADSAADRAGLQEGDVIVNVNRQDVRSAREAVAEATKSRDTQALVLVWSEGSNRFLVLDLNGEQR